MLIIVGLASKPVFREQDMQSSPRDLVYGCGQITAVACGWLIYVPSPQGSAAASLGR